MAPPLTVAIPQVSEQEAQVDKLKLYDIMLGAAKPMAVRAAVLLNIPDIIAEASGSLTVKEIAAHIAEISSPPHIEYLFRLLRFLASQEVFTEIPHQEDFRQTRFGLTGISKLLVKGTRKGGVSVQNYVPYLLAFNNDITVKGWLHLHESVLQGGCAFSKAFGMSYWDYAAKNPEANKNFNEAMSCDTRAVMSSVLEIYEEGFKKINSLVDIGGGVGSALSIIVEKYKHIRGINFDLPHVIASALPIPGVQHVSGNMFEHIPSADAIFIKWVLHDWDDDDCIKVLRRCYEATPANGKVIIVDALVVEAKKDENNKDLQRGVGLEFDMGMMLYCSGGKERTEMEFKQIFIKAGFKSYTIFKLPSIQTIFEVSKF
ncbi:(R,S)-reticuline 7-O-methyltransferase-like [Cryptomeria japonica]|uniref:(R,S)-reticuline 7-O-methyltransferase-like n=1 Tax=Cryptomeria japonica TaxID=3369 RepID=UPI0025ACEE92|nr:(R,S)-reticuline 7-O-methyltransferase-like [Cryptomeria japonica]